MDCPIKCVCGAEARIRTTGIYTWVECRKKCGKRTGVYASYHVEDEHEMKRQAVEAWNRLVKVNE